MFFEKLNMDIATINKTLYRPLKSGTNYNKYFVKSSCTPTRLNTGNTKVAISEMAKWVKKYSSHTAEIAKSEFSKIPFSELPNAIHNFLYNHIQYKIDENDQNLKSPACAWATRKQGTDCKSFSLFAAAICRELGVKTFFRRIKQPNIFPDAFTHVYVVVPKDQKTGNIKSGYDVIDATLKVNKETPFLEKDDIMNEPSLPIYGLAAPLRGLSCSTDTSCGCSSGVSNLPALAMPGATKIEKKNLDIVYKALDSFLKYAISKGLPAELANTFMQRFRAYISAGIEPTAGQLFGIKNTNAFGLGSTGIVAPLLLNTNQLPTSTGINTTNTGGGIFNTIGSFVPGGNIIASLIPTEFIDKTIGSFIANGLKIKCIGASYSPAAAAKDIPTSVAKINQLAQDAVNVSPEYLPQSINNFYVKYYGLNDGWRHWYSAKDCTKDGIDTLLKATDALKDQYTQKFKQIIEAYGGQVTMTTQPFDLLSNGSTKYGVKKIQIEKVNVYWINGKPVSTQTTINPGGYPTNNGGISPDLSNTYIDDNGQIKEAQPKTQEAGFGTVAIIGLLAIAGGAYYFKNKK